MFTSNIHNFNALVYLLHLMLEFKENVLVMGEPKRGGVGNSNNYHSYIPLSQNRGRPFLEHW